jgi:hypothetical protein
MISQEELKKYLRYEPETGLFFWREYKTFVPGSAAGRVGDKGYVVISLNGCDYRAHRLAWVMVNGEIPEGMHIDHINGVKADNPIANLRLATNSQNGMNRPQVRTTTTGYKGVSKRYNKFAAYIKLNDFVFFANRHRWHDLAHGLQVGGCWADPCGGN